MEHAAYAHSFRCIHLCMINIQIFFSFQEDLGSGIIYQILQNLPYVMSHHTFLLMWKYYQSDWHSLVINHT